MFALLFAVSFVAVRPANATMRAQGALLTMAAEQPETAVRVIVQKTGLSAEVEALVTDIGGTVATDLSIINGYVATLPGKHIPTLAQSTGVRWISLDTPMVKNTCTGCVDTAQATSAWLQTTKAKELWTKCLVRKDRA